MASNLSVFFESIRQQQKLLAIALSGTLASNLLCYLWGPPPIRNVCAATSVLELTLLLFIFSVRSRIKKYRKKIIVTASTAVFLSFAGYFHLFQSYTVQPFRDRPRIVKGYQLNDPVREMLQRNVYSTADEALRAFQYDPERVWTPLSIYHIQALIWLSWTLLVLCFSTDLFVFVLSDLEVRAAGRGRPDGISKATPQAM